MPERIWLYISIAFWCFIWAQITVMLVKMKKAVGIQDQYKRSEVVQAFATKR